MTLNRLMLCVCTSAIFVGVAFSFVHAALPLVVAGITGFTFWPALFELN